MDKEDFLKIIELVILVGSFLIVTAQLHSGIYMSALSSFIQLNTFAIQNEGNLTQAQKIDIHTELQNLDQYRYNHQQMSVWLTFFGFILITSSLVCIWLFITFGISKEKKYKKIALAIASFILLLFILFFSFFWLSKTAFTS